MDRTTHRRGQAEGLAVALGWFSVALGVAEVVAPRRLGRAIGVRSSPSLLRAMGLREIASGVGILTGQRRTGLWSRVAGDAVDLALLGQALSSTRSNRARVAAATAAVAGVAALDIYGSVRASRAAAQPATLRNDAREPVRERVTVAASAQECYRLWRDFPNLPRFMRNVESVQQTGDDQWHWVVKAPGGGTVEWDARVTADEPDRRLAWATLPGAEVQNEGSVTFEPAPGGRGTIVSVAMSYVPPAGALGAVAAKVTGDSPAQVVAENLRRFKQLVETGEIPTTEGQPAGRRSLAGALFTQGDSR
jgi:uncharacterized membrane protein